MDVEKTNTVSAKEIDENVADKTEKENAVEGPKFPALSAQDMAVGRCAVMRFVGQRGDTSHSLSSKSIHILLV